MDRLIVDSRSIYNSPWMSLSVAKITQLFFILFVSLLTITLPGCTSLQLYHPYNEKQPEFQKLNFVHRTDCSKVSNKELSYGFIEFDEFGNLMNVRSYNKLMSEIHNTNQPVLLVSYTHGWKHSADDKDEDVKEFKGAMKNIAAMDSCSNRKVIGIYTGWRGGVTKIPVLENLTFWDRKNTAHAVGGGDMTEVLLRLEGERNWHNAKYASVEKSRMIYVGHSFGTAVLYTALAPIMVERFVHSSGIGVTGVCQSGAQIEGVGDLVVLLNPAFEAMKFGNLFRLTQQCQFTSVQPVVLAVVTGRNDIATGRAFPIARGLRASLQEYWPGKDIGFKANTEALGHYEDYITHDLKTIDHEQGQSSVATNRNDDSCDFPYEDPTRAKVAGGMMEMLNSEKSVTYKFKNFDLELTPTANHQPHSPIMNISGDSEIINHHGGIYGCRLMSFIGELIHTGAPEFQVNRSSARNTK
ncbi:hypothetical protein [Pseudomonas sp.]|uniref:hypothetical protein n=1 Tax=Pseudomonas sp. TaxID=306 RepID=UPI00290AF1FB|nr:hypothetical protein [Pseudomonas sp.]MDU4255840.1 hypothetical protein [Pseudomonas sp.]